MSVAQTTYYVDAVDGNDGNDGLSALNAWKTVSKVSGFGGYGATPIIRFKRGLTYYGQVIPQVSGMTFDAYGTGTTPIITGGQTLSSWESLGGGVFQASLTVRPTNVVVGGVQRPRGRTPDNGYWNQDAVTGSGGNATITATELAGANWTGAKVVHRPERWIINNETITAHTGSVIDFAYTYYAPRQDYGFFITDDIDCVTSYGEWFWDDPTDKLKVYFGSSGTSNVTASAIQDLIAITGVTGATFRNLEFSFAYRDLVRVVSSTNVLFENCIFRNGYNGVQAASGNCNNLTIRSCSFFDINNNGIRLEDASSVNNFLLEYSDMHRVAIVPGEGGNDDGQYNGINMGGSAASPGPVAGAILRYNRMDSIGYVGIMGGGDNLLVQNNVVNEYCYIKDDGGGIYGFSRAAINKRITGNIVINGGLKSWEGTDNQYVHAYGIYADGNSDKISIDNNTVINAAEGLFLHIPGPDVSMRNNTVFGSRNVGMMIWNTDIGFVPNQFITSQDVKHNIIMSLNLSDKVADFQDMATAINDDIGTWDVIDSNYYMRPLADGAKIYSNPASNYYTLSAWTALFGHDAHSYNSPKTFAASINPNDSIKIYYNDTQTPLVQAIPGRWIDHAGNVYNNSVTISPYRSIVLLADGATEIPSGPTQSGYVNWTTPIDDDYAQLPGQESVGGIRKKTTSVQGWDNGIVRSVEAITEGESFEFATGYQSDPYIAVGLHPTTPSTIVGNTAVLFGLRGGNTTAPQTESGIVVHEAGADNYATYQAATVDSPWYRIKYEGGQIKYGKSIDEGITFTDFYTSTIAPSGTYYLLFQGYDPGDMLRIVRKTGVATPVNQLPVASAGADKAITLPTAAVQLDGVGTDADGSITNVQWVKLSGPAGGSLSNAGILVTTANSLVAGTYIYRLTVTDNQGASASDDVQVTVNAAPGVIEPIANAGADSIVTAPRNFSFLLGALDEGSAVTYKWEKVTGPARHRFLTPGAATTKVDLLSVGTYTFRFSAISASGAIASDEKVVTVLPTAVGGRYYITNVSKRQVGAQLQAIIKYEDNTFTTVVDNSGSPVSSVRQRTATIDGAPHIEAVVFFANGTSLVYRYK
jgi:hypothetical protein